ncbi:asparagine--tRNA ligase, partial [bacterium]|nr:asparagine--tRNA ligase [bacterium]
MYELKVCANKTDTSLIEKLQRYLDNKFPVIEYKEAINLLKKDQSENKVTFENKDIFDGLDLGSEHEKYICEKVFNLPTFIINYPKEIKAFYMKLN